MTQAVSSTESSDDGKEFPSGSEGYSDSNSSSNTRGKIIGKMRDNFRGVKKKGIQNMDYFMTLLNLKYEIRSKIPK